MLFLIVCKNETIILAETIVLEDGRQKNESICRAEISLKFSNSKSFRKLLLVPLTLQKKHVFRRFYVCFIKIQF